MTSSMLAGERRWASARRGGMTVLGKVAVPKPLNLPSQKLENHGLDPNVEIVPKGSLSWGSRPSSSTSNPWGSSAVSPNSDGNTNTNTNTVSPRHPSGRPTSGGGLSRPSTAGSDRVHESSWGPNSRPSSASGVLTSNQSSLTVSRPLSAETRPGSSHLSRFAEPVFDNSMAWGPNGTVDKLSIPSKGNDFSLSSGDFPTLGSEKDNPPKSSDPHDQDSHVRPGSASGRGAHTNERNEMSHADHKSGTVDTWTREGPPHMGENWQGDPHQYGPPQHYDAWRGPPMNAPGVWYRGPPPPAGPPYTPVPHGGYPMEPFPYYRGPQIPPPLANSQQGPGPRAHHPRNNDFYRPNMPDAFIRPGMPMRPGFYPGPVPYEGYFGPPMGYNPNPNPNPNDRDNPFMGMPPPGPHGHGPPVYNMCPPQNPSEINDPHFRGGGPRGPNMFVPEHSDSVPPEEPRGPYKVLRKRENERPNADVDEGNWDQMQHTSTINSLAVEKNENQPRPSFHKNDHRSTDSRRGEDVVPSRRNNNTLVENPSSRMLGNQNYPSSNKPSNESWGKRSESVTPVVPEVAQDVPVNSKDPSLIQKIEGLNAKVRASDVASGNLREEPKNNRFVNQKDNSTLTFGTISNTEDLPNPRDINVVRGDNTNKSTTGNTPLISRQPHHGVRKGSTNNQNNDGWRKKPSIVGSDTGQNVGQVSAENPEAKNNTVESLTPMVDSSDGQAQRARMRELAKQRAIQLQKEEEERIKEQKAKALAKLEELNRRTLAADGTTQTAEGTTTNVPEPENVEDDQKPTGQDPDASKTEVASSEVETKTQPAVQVSKNIQPSVHVSKSSQQEPVVKQTDAENRSVPVPVSSSTQQRKRNNKSSKSKPKGDDTSAALVDADVAKQEAPLLPLPQVELESSKDNKDSVHSNNQYNKGQHQHQRRMARNNHPQAARSADRFHGNDGVMWAPVRANKEERGGDEYTQQNVHDDVAVSSKSSGNSVQSNLKSRRAEMERYVPKPVAKELAQQGTTTTNQQSASPVIDNKEEVSSEAPVPVPVTVIDNKQNRPVKSQQHKKSNPKPVSQQEVVRSETNATHEWDPSDGWFMPEYPPPATEVAKDEGGGGGNKGKKPVSSYNKTQRSTVKNHEEVETERPTSAKENRSSHWQPKPQGYNAEHGGERKPRGGRIHSPNNMEDEQAQFDQQQQQSGFRKYGGGGGGRHNVNRERQARQNLHYEYQPVGVGANSNSNNTSSSNNNNNNNNNADGSGNTGGGPRYKGQGQGQPRRGGGSFYGRQ